MPYVAAIQLVIFILCVYSYFVHDLIKAVMSSRAWKAYTGTPYSVSTIGLSALFMAVTFQ
jgi:hypothetical protein